MRILLSMLDLPLLSLAVSHSLRPEMMRTDEHSKNLNDVENEM